MPDDKSLSYEAKMIIASNLAVAHAVLRAGLGTTTPATPIEAQVRGFMVSAASGLEGLEAEIETHMAKKAAKSQK